MDKIKVHASIANTLIQKGLVMEAVRKKIKRIKRKRGHDQGDSILD